MQVKAGNTEIKTNLKKVNFFKKKLSNNTVGQDIVHTLKKKLA